MLIGLVFLQTALNMYAASKAIPPSPLGNLIYSYAYIFISIYWLLAHNTKIAKASFDNGFFYMFAYPFFLIYASFKNYGFWKGFGMFLLLIGGYVVPSYAYNTISIWMYYS